MTEQQRTLWARRRQRGALHFVLCWGLLAWGLSFGLVVPLIISGITSLVGAQAEGWSYLEWLSLTVPLGMTAGVCWGWAIWHITEEKYLFGPHIPSETLRRRRRWRWLVWSALFAAILATGVLLATAWVRGEKPFYKGPDTMLRYGLIGVPIAAVVGGFFGYWVGVRVTRSRN